MDTKYFNFETVKLAICWFVAVAISNSVSEGVDDQYVSIMFGGLFSAVSLILISLGMILNIRSKTFWGAVAFVAVLSLNMYIWLTPIRADFLPTGAWIGASVVSLAALTTINNIRIQLLKYPPQISENNEEQRGK